MSSGLLLSLAVLALLFFWMLGAYNRVVALRSPIIAAWAQLEVVLQARRQAMAGLLVAAEPRLAAERAALEAVIAAQAQLGQAADAVRPRPAHAESVAALARADAALVPALARLASLIEQQPDWREDAALAEPLQALRDLAPRWQFARQVFNEASAAYNAAVLQFPTRLLSGVFHFGRAGQL
ncbi:LemA family protein [Aquabacterium sp.]|uniref:LemA family protein n=1 Tax=Aquabacterium sp. TaxID=1872578 RepID=UPI002C4538C9|nr:LemA family protein [Aquabacterium sp.]HSW07852.1 LemA family protein [Aquabacterium sp.]